MFSQCSSSHSCLSHYPVYIFIPLFAFSMSVFLPSLPDCHDYDFLSVLNATI